MYRVYFLFLFVVVLSLTQTSAKKDRIKLKDVGALTFYHNEYAKSRRYNSIPQLRCVGGTAKGEFTPKVVQCINSGYDGVDVQWQCKADLKNKYSFGKIVVNCEGYDYPEDDYILAGSCGLEYELDYSGNQYDRKRSSYFSESQDSHKSSENSIFGFGFIIFALCAISLIYFCLPKTGQNSRPEPSAPPPPPGFHSGLFGDSYPNYSNRGCSSEQYSRPTSSSTASNLWSGALGAGLGYMLGRNSSNNYGYTEQRYNYNRTSDNNDNSSDNVRTATGFATTKRR